QIDALVVEVGERLQAVGRCERLEVAHLQVTAHEIAQGLLVVHDEYAGPGRHHPSCTGRVKRTQAPFVRGSTQMSPPCARTKPCAIVSPSPAPLWLRVNPFSPR